MGTPTIKGGKKKMNQASYLVKGFRLFDKVKFVGRRNNGKEVKIMEKKWYLGEVSAEGDRVFTFQATDEEYRAIQNFVDASTNNVFINERWSGVVYVYKVSFDTKEEAEKFFGGSWH